MIKIYIGGKEVVCDKTFTITEQLLTTSSTILNNCYPKEWENDHDYVSRFFFPKDYSSCEIYNDNTLIFAGLVENSGDVSLRPTDPKYCSLQILDYKTLLSEGETLDFVIDNKTIAQAIQMVVDTVADYGFVLGNIIIDNPNTTINAYSTLNKTAYDVFQYLADLSQAKWFTRMVDKDTVAIDFYKPSAMTRANDIQYTKEYFCQNNILDISFNFGTRDYRNKQTILSDKVYGDITRIENIIADGYQKTFNTLENIGKLEIIKVNGVSKTFGTDSDKKLGIYADFYYTPGKNIIESDDYYNAGTVINVEYTPLIKGRQVAYNNSEISRIKDQTNRKGTISRYENRNDIVSSNELLKIGQTYIKYKGTPEIILTVRTKNKDLFNVGQQVYFDMPNIEEIATNYMVKKKDIQITKTGESGIIFYTYELSSSYNSEEAINYFDNQRNKNSGSLDEGKFITRNIDIESTANIIFDNLQITEITPVGDNVLNCVLNAPFTK
jgi:hypothetical protein